MVCSFLFCLSISKLPSLAFEFSSSSAFFLCVSRFIQLCVSECLSILILLCLLGILNIRILEARLIYPGPSGPCLQNSASNDWVWKRCYPTTINSQYSFFPGQVFITVFMHNVLHFHFDPILYHLFRTFFWKMGLCSLVIYKNAGFCILLFLINGILYHSAEHVLAKAVGGFSEELLLIFPAINLLSSPSRSVKAAASDLLSVLENILIDLLVERNKITNIQERLPTISTPESIVSRMMRHQWFQVCLATLPVHICSIMIILLGNSRNSTTSLCFFYHVYYMFCSPLCVLIKSFLLVCLFLNDIFIIISKVV